MVTRITRLRQSDCKTQLAVVGAVTAAFMGAKLLRSALIWAQYTLLPPMIDKYQGDWALVTGGSEGVGKAVAAELARHGLNVVLVSRSQGKLDAAATEIKKKHPAVQVRTYAADLTDTTSYSKLLQHLTDNSIHVSVLIANLGGTPEVMLKPFWNYTDPEEAAIQKMNGQSCYSLVRGLLPGMIADHKGAIVCISSIMHKLAAYAAPYGSEKAKMNALCEALDVELQGTGVTAQAMVLGQVITPTLIRVCHPDLLANSGSSSDADIAAAIAKVKPDAFKPSAETVAAAIVRCIGRGGPVVTPFWGHGAFTWLLHSLLWPPELNRAVLSSLTRKAKADWDQLHRTAGATKQALS